MRRAVRACVTRIDTFFNLMLMAGRKARMTMASGWRAILRSS